MEADAQRPSMICQPLRPAYGPAPLAAGADEDFNLLTDWSKHLPAGPAATRDVVTAAGAFALARLAGLRDGRWFPFARHSGGSPTHAAAK